jgi:hypothetical protein
LEGVEDYLVENIMAKHITEGAAVVARSVYYGELSNLENGFIEELSTIAE